MIDRSFPALSPTAQPTAAAEFSAPAPLAPASNELADAPDPRRELTRLAAGLGLAALYGLGLGARSGGLSLLRHAFAASAGLAAVGVLGVPSLFVLLALVNAPVSPGAMIATGARALGSAGFVLAGLAPSAALLAVTIESASAAAFIARVGLVLAGGIGLFQLVSSVRLMLAQLPFAARLRSNALLAGFCVFAILLAARVWYTLPILQVGA